MWVKGAIIAGGSTNVQSVEKSQCGDFSKQNTRSSSIPCCLFGHILKRHTFYYRDSHLIIFGYIHNSQEMEIVSMGGKR